MKELIMDKVLLIAGQKFGKWTVIEEVDQIKKNRRFLCKCDCGKNNIVYKTGILSGSSTQCQTCANKIKAQKSQTTPQKLLAHEMIGKQFGEWTVLEECNEKSANGGSVFLCKCSCGIEKKVQGILLRRGTSKKCIKCSNKNNIPPCRFCKCSKGHLNIDLEESMCDFLGFCPRCDKFKYDDFVNPKEDFLI